MPPIAPLSAAARQRAAEYTGLQRHVAFFDQRSDGVIHPSETYAQLRELKRTRFEATKETALIHAGLGDRRLRVDVRPVNILGAEVPLPHVRLPSFTIDVANIAKKKHRSDTDIYDTSGNVDWARFDAVFDSLDVEKTGTISQEQLFEMVHGRKDDTLGHIASKGEFSLLMNVAGRDEIRDGRIVRVIDRDSLRKVYDGTLFYDLAHQTPPWER